MTILIVDDNAEVRRVIRATIADLVANIYECSDGAQAAAACLQHQPDWVLMDIEMSGVDGLAATRQVRYAFPNARVVIVTAHDAESLREAARRAGAIAYVHKEDLSKLRT